MRPQTRKLRPPAPFDPNEPALPSSTSSGLPASLTPASTSIGYDGADGGWAS